ncbi:MAG: LytTR family transcriptional regulator DNA-binding domain-containing protein [Bacteroidota bacterium]
MIKKIVIIDDEPLARMLVKEYLSEVASSDFKFEIVGECNDGFEGVKTINELKPDLIFLDIQMPKINGFEMLEIIAHEPKVIFTTAFDEYALKAFETNAIDYLLKPFSKERFDMAIDKFQSATQTFSNEIQVINNIPNKHLEEANRIVVKDGSEIQIIPTQDVDFIEAYDDYVKIYTKEKYHLKKKTLSYYETNLDAKNFIRIHRSFILNISKLTKIESFEKNSYIAILSSGKRIPISRTMYPILKEKLGI